MELQNQIVAFSGRKGAGKSTQFRELLQRQPFLFVFDPRAEHGWIPNRLTDVEGVEAFFAWACDQGAAAARFVPGAGGVEESLEAVSEIVFDYGGVWFGVEEIAMVCSPSYLPPNLDLVVRQGRHRHVSLAYTCQRLSEVSRTLTSLTDRFYLFRTDEPRDCQAIADRCSSAVADRVARLPRHGFLVWNVEEVRVLQPTPSLSGRLG